MVYGAFLPFYCEIYYSFNNRIMNKSTFYRELYRFLEREDSGVWGWVNLSDEEYKNISLELSNTKRYFI